MNNNEYNASKIKKLEGLEGVRKRPDMYIGDTQERGLHHCVFEIIDNSIDEALAGYCNNIIVTIHKNGFCSVQDNGRGIPVDNHPIYNVPTLELVMTNLHAGGKFDEGAYKVSGGLHGVGVKCVNAVSEVFIVEVKRNNKVYSMEFQYGKTSKNLEIKGVTSTTGTKVTFLPDKTIFVESISFKYNILAQRVRELCFLNPGIKIELYDEINNKKDIFYYEKGISEYIIYLNKNKKLLHDNPVYFFGNLENNNFQDQNDKIYIEIAFQYNLEYQERIYAYANSILNTEGGTHLSGFKTGLTRVINSFAKSNNLLKEKDPILTGEDIREGITAIISVKLKNPRFEGQTKTRLSNKEVDSIIQKFINDNLKEYLEINKKFSKKLIEKIINAARSREAAKKARETVRKNNNISNSLPGKLVDCTSKNPEISELYIVEGNSAGGSAKQGRDREYQAILPIRGKIINSEKSSLDKLLNNEEIKNLVTAIGVGIKENEESILDIKKLRYHKIIIMADADIDGAHIQTLILTFIYKYMKELIDKGFIYIAQPPLFKIKKNKFETYLRNEESLKSLLIKMGIKSSILKIENINEEIFFKDNELENIYSIVSKLNFYGNKILNFGYSFKNFINLYNILDNRLPEYLIKIEKNYTYFYNEIDYLNFLHKNKNNFEYYKIENLNEIKNLLFQLFNINKNLLFNKIKIFKINENKDIIFEEILISILDLEKSLINIGKIGVTLQRYKGLGEMNPHQLYETTMDPKKRVLVKIQIEDENLTNDTFKMLMGDNVELRKAFIEKNILIENI